MRTHAAPDLLALLAPYFERYLTLERVHPTKTYDYIARGFRGEPVIDVTMHGPKCKRGESWIYVAIPHGARLDALKSDEKLYVGAQTQDRMFRGDGGVGPTNYHHAEMRSGKGKDNPIAYLRSGTKIAIYRATADALANAVVGKSELAKLRSLLQQQTTAKKHRGWWFEQLLLYTYAGHWRWNTAAAEREAAFCFTAIFEQCDASSACSLK